MSRRMAGAIRYSPYSQSPQGIRSRSRHDRACGLLVEAPVDKGRRRHAFHRPFSQAQLCTSHGPRGSGSVVGRLVGPLGASHGLELLTRRALAASTCLAVHTLDTFLATPDAEKAFVTCAALRHTNLKSTQLENRAHRLLDDKALSATVRELRQDSEHATHESLWQLRCASDH